MQLIAANIDTVFVARLERYVALAFKAGIEPVIVLTKADLTDDTAPYIDAAQAVSERVQVVALDARGAEPAQVLADWCKPGRTVAFLGSSGVGKSTLTNALLGAQAIDYLLKRWDAFTRFLDDGRLCLSNNAAERALRGVAVGRRNWTFAGSDSGGRRAAAIYTLIETCKLNDVDAKAWLADVLARIADHPARHIDQLLPWNWKPA